MATDKKADLPGEEQFYSHNVEEAVMHIVGGTLHDEGKKRKPAFDPFNIYMNSPGWDILEPIQQEFFPPVQNRKKRRVEANVDPALNHIYHTPPPQGHPSSAGHQHHQHLDLAGHSDQSHGADHSGHGISHSVAHSVHPVHPVHPVHSAASPLTQQPPTPLSSASQPWDNGDTAGSFSPEEIKALDTFMDQFCIQQNLTRQQLCDRVWSSDRKKDSFWDSVTAVLPHRTRASVYKHVRRSYHVFGVRGKWTAADDQQLKLLFEEKGAQWKAIGRALERMPEDCRDRWRNYVKCGERRNENKWTPEEEKLLEQAVAAVSSLKPGPINWTAVSERMGGTRSRIQCRYKWGKITKLRS